ncbi:unnamed protein product [Diabrotica balteata]|uniref:Uncharacterized protein n=1 Tax=Diabrotica balteata TaxID=107213 RepID=A0A9N9T8T8_DIABA|nr:unnamed protein product [Diabrotica balteata]
MELVDAKAEKEEKERLKKIKLKLKKENQRNKRNDGSKEKFKGNQKTKSKSGKRALFNESNSDVSDTDCLFCEDSKSRENEGWIKCSVDVGRVRVKNMYLKNLPRKTEN